MPLSDILAARRISVLEYIARTMFLPTWRSAGRLIYLSVVLLVASGNDVLVDRPRTRWIDQVRQDSNTSPVELWRRAIQCDHGAGATQRPSPATRSWRWWWWWGDYSCRLLLALSVATRKMDTAYQCCPEMKAIKSFVDVTVRTFVLYFTLL